MVVRPPGGGDSGTTPDYHTQGDVEEKTAYAKMEKVTRLTYLVAMDIGNKPSLLKLDVLPEVTTRGKHNRKVVWQRPPQPGVARSHEGARLGPARGSCG